MVSGGEQPKPRAANQGRLDRRAWRAGRARRVYSVGPEPLPPCQRFNTSCELTRLMHSHRAARPPGHRVTGTRTEQSPPGSPQLASRYLSRSVPATAATSRQPPMRERPRVNHSGARAINRPEAGGGPADQDADGPVAWRHHTPMWVARRHRLVSRTPTGVPRTALRTPRTRRRVLYDLSTAQDLRGRDGDPPKRR